MKTVAVACQTLQDEIMFVIRDLGIKYPVLWIESMQHNNSQKLNLCLQEQIKRIGNTDTILLLFGNCGRAIQGLTSRGSRRLLSLSRPPCHQRVIRWMKIGFSPLL